jgi:hypothetical protein
MTRKLLLAPVLAGVLLAAGCGGGDDDGGDGGKRILLGLEVLRAVDSCKRSVDRAGGLSSDVKNDLRDLATRPARATQTRCATPRGTCA